MRVIEIVPGIAEEASGPTYSVMRLCEALIANGQSVTLGALDLPGTGPQAPFVRTFPLGFGPQRLGRSPAMSRWLGEECASGRVDLLHNHGMWHMTAIYPARAAGRATIPLVQSTRGAFSEWAMRWGSKTKPAFWRFLQEPAMRRVSCFHATADSEYADIRRLGFRQPVAVIPNGIDIPADHRKRADGQRTLLFLGRIHQNKGLDLLLPAWRAVQDEFPQWRLSIVGPDEAGYRGRMERLAAQLRVDRVSFDGPAYGEAKTAAYRDANLFVLPSYSENFGMAVAEALAAGTPVVVSKGAPWGDVVNEKAGWWVDAGLEPLIGGLRAAMATSEAELTAMGARGRSWMLRDFGWQDIGRRMGATYEWVLNRSVPPSWVMVD